MEPEVKEAMLCQDIEWSHLQSTSGSGSKTYDAPVTIKGYQVGRISLGVNKKGEEVTSSQQIFVDEVNALLIDEGDLIKPMGSIKSYPVVRIEPFRKIGGVVDYGIAYLK